MSKLKFYCQKDFTFNGVTYAFLTQLCCYTISVKVTQGRKKAKITKRSFSYVACQANEVKKGGTCFEASERSLVLPLPTRTPVACFVLEGRLDLDLGRAKRGSMLPFKTRSNHKKIE